jgi:hypothetical protein
MEFVQVADYARSLLFQLCPDHTHLFIEEEADTEVQDNQSDDGAHEEFSQEETLVSPEPSFHGGIVEVFFLAGLQGMDLFLEGIQSAGGG